MVNRVVLIGCVAAKLPDVAAARDLYTSPLFVKRRDYAEASGHPWAILSAAHGLLLPDDIVHPYNLELKKPAIADWSARVRLALVPWLVVTLGFEPASTVLEAHAGVHYVDGLERCARWLEAFGTGAPTVEAPLQGLGIGRQLGWYRSRELAAGAS